MYLSNKYLDSLLLHFSDSWDRIDVETENNFSLITLKACLHYLLGSGSVDGQSHVVHTFTHCFVGDFFSLSRSFEDIRIILDVLKFHCIYLKGWVFPIYFAGILLMGAFNLKSNGLPFCEIFFINSLIIFSSVFAWIFSLWCSYELAFESTAQIFRALSVPYFFF